MVEQVLEKIDTLIEILYSVDKNDIDKNFMELIESLLQLVEVENLAGNLEFNQILMELQNAYVKKDLVELADVLSYRLKPFVE